MTKKSTLDLDYTTGDLSNFPNSIDTKETLYEVKNNAETKLRSSLGFNSKIIIVEDASAFPDQGIIRVGSGSAYELIYYASKSNNVLSNLTRGFAGSRQNQWSSGSSATNSVAAEPHNAVKDAIINMQTFLGTKENPADGSLNSRLINLENKFLAPRAFFRAFPKSCRPGKSVKFQSFCDGDVIRYLWDFGDGTQSTIKHPTHTYYSEGLYTVTLNIITASGGQGIFTKSDYIYISNSEGVAFFYTKKIASKKYEFIDQTDGDIKQRFWVFGDGSDTVVVDDPNKHSIIHEYQNSGTFNPSLLINFADDRLKRIFLPKKGLIVT